MTARGVAYRHRPHEGRLKAHCWCERKVLYVPVELVRRCETVSCGHPACHPPHADA